MNYPGSLHNHTDYSNIRGRDSINKVNELMHYALELEHSVLAYTEHECLSNSIKIQEEYENIKKDNPNFKVILGNEIYLTRNGLNNENFDATEDKYYHFILLAKDAEGYKQIRKLSTRAWLRSYMARGLRRVPTYYQDLEEIIAVNPGHVIASTACIGGYCGQQILKFFETNDEQYTLKVSEWCKYIANIFGQENFYLELQPGDTQEQFYVNKVLLSLAEQKGYKYIITTDSHYLKKEDRKIHKIYLQSQDIEREVDSFYSTCYMMNTEELEGYLSYMSREQLDYAYQNILDIQEKCQDYDLKKELKIPQLKWHQPQNINIDKNYIEKMPNIKLFQESEFEGDNLLATLLLEKIATDNSYQTEETYAEVNQELATVWESSLVNKTHWSSYFLNLQEIIETCWEAGSIVLPGRGSGVGFLLLNILGITQINPLREKTKTYAWRFLNPKRASVLDVDFDISGLKRGQVLEAFRKKYGQDRVANVITFAVEKSKSAILTTARGLGIDNDIAQYIASLIPSDRGMIRNLAQCYYGDKENDYKPVSAFVQQMKEYPELWEAAQKIEGLVCRCGIHAGGVIFVDEPFTNSCSLMRAPDGTIVTGYDLHDSEKVSLIKYDALSVEAADRIQVCLELLDKYGLIEHKDTLKKLYESTIGIYNLERDDPKMWEMVWNHKIQSLFQMEQQSGIQGIALTHPSSVDDLATLNSIIRLMAQDKGEELPLQKYARFKNNINFWYEEMDRYGLTLQEQNKLKEVLSISYGICESQERFMTLVQLPECGGHDLSWADRLRKAIAKKNPTEYNQLEQEFFETAKQQSLSYNFCNYVWHVLVATSRGYGFNLSHTLAYSLIALQEMNLAFKFPIIYWNCANLIVDSGSLDEEEKEEIVPINAYEKEDIKNGAIFEDLLDRSGKIKKTTNTNYDKIAKAINKMQASDIHISLIDINKSGYTFEPDEENNTILYGMNALNGVGGEIVQQIIENRPYLSFEDFMEVNSFNKTVMVSLIKAGAFDCFGERKDIMKQYIWSVCEPKKRITMQNFNGLVERNLVPEELSLQKRTFVFNKALKHVLIDGKYCLRDNFYDFYEEFFDIDLLEPYGEVLSITKEKWKKQYDKMMAPAKKWITDNKIELLEKLNDCLFQEMWNKYAEGNYSSWEMNSLGFYYHGHELLNIDFDLYNIIEYNNLPEEPRVDYCFRKNGHEIPIFKTYRICGTVIAKDDTKSCISVLTPHSGVVTVKFTRDYYAHYNRRISEVQIDGTKKVKEAGFFQRGTLIIVNGFRRGDMFIEKTYRKTNSHGLYKITAINKDGSLEITNKRWGEND